MRITSTTFEQTGCEKWTMKKLSLWNWQHFFFRLFPFCETCLAQLRWLFRRLNRPVGEKKLICNGIKSGRSGRVNISSVADRRPLPFSLACWMASSGTICSNNTHTHPCAGCHWFESKFVSRRLCDATVFIFLVVASIEKFSIRPR